MDTSSQDGLRAAVKVKALFIPADPSQNPRTRKTSMTTHPATHPNSIPITHPNPHSTSQTHLLPTLQEEEDGGDER
ncbi:hypothetical protein EON65_24170, partial [archaeon]